MGIKHLNQFSYLGGPTSYRFFEDMSQGMISGNDVMWAKQCHQLPHFGMVYATYLHLFAVIVAMVYSWFTNIQQIWET